MARTAALPSASVSTRKRFIFRRTTDPLSVLEPGDPDEAVNPKLLNAMVCVKRAQPDPSAFTQYLALSGQELNAPEVYGLFGWARTFNPANFDHFPCALEPLRFVARNKVHTSHTKVAVVMKPWFDEVLTVSQQHGRMRKGRRFRPKASSSWGRCLSPSPSTWR